MIFKELRSGQSVYNKEIEASIVSGQKSKKYIYLIAGTHGDEVEGVYVLDQLYKWLQESNSLKDLPIVVVPVLNIDGHEAGTRVNARAVDLNRNLPTENWSPDFKKDRYNPGESAGSEPENKFLLKLFGKYPPGIVLSFHSWKPMVNYNGDCKEVAEHISSFNKYEVTDDIGYPTPGSLGTYVPEKLNASIITFECPELSTGMSLKEVWEESEEALKSLFTEDKLISFTS